MCYSIRGIFFIRVFAKIHRDLLKSTFRQFTADLGNPCTTVDMKYFNDKLFELLLPCAILDCGEIVLTSLELTSEESNTHQ